MSLRKWIDSKWGNGQWLAKETGLHWTTIWRLASGKTYATPETAALIEAATSRRVGWRSLVKGYSVTRVHVAKAHKARREARKRRKEEERLAKEAAEELLK